VSDARDARAAPRPAGSAARYDVVVVGAGPYGLSTAAHLLGRGLRTAVFGRTLELWREHMPKGMLLRSHWWATNLSDPGGRHGFRRFFEESRYQACYPVPIEAFIDYALLFKERVVPDVDETYVASVERRDSGFALTLVDGREVRSAAVVMATGLRDYANRPEAYHRLAPGLVSHSCDHNDFGRFRGKQLLVIGGGQSAIEYAALLHEAGARVHVVSRRPIVWLPPDRANERSLFERIAAPNSGIAPGWRNWILERAPYLFYRFPRERKAAANRNYYLSAASDWLRGRVIGKVALHEGHTVVGMDAAHGGVEAVLSDGETVRADHVLMATGYAIDVGRLKMIHPSLRSEIETVWAAPALSPWFESSVPGLYFVGLTSLPDFGPLYRFVAGCGATASRVAGAVARRLTSAAAPRAGTAWRPSSRPGTSA